MKNWVVATVAGAVLVSGLGMGTVAMADYDDVRTVKVAKQSKVKISLAQAKKIALGLFKGADIEEIELEKKNGRLVYHVEFENRKDKEDEAYIDAITGKVTWEKDFNDDDDDDNNKKVKKPAPKPVVKISKEQAKKIALAKVPGKVEEVELEKENGKYVYEVEIDAKKGDDAKVKISAATGKIIKVDFED